MLDGLKWINSDCDVIFDGRGVYHPTLVELVQCTYDFEMVAPSGLWRVHSDMKISINSQYIGTTVLKSSSQHRPCIHWMELQPACLCRFPCMVMGRQDPTSYTLYTCTCTSTTKSNDVQVLHGHHKS